MGTSHLIFLHSFRRKLSQEKLFFQSNWHGRTDYNCIIARKRGETHNVNRGNIDEANLHLYFHCWFLQSYIRLGAFSAKAFR